MLNSGLTIVLENEATSCFERLSLVTRTICPDVRISISKTGSAESATIVASFLRDVTDDEVAVSVEFEAQDGLSPRCEVTLFVGQHTWLNVTRTGWAEQEPMCVQAERIVHEGLLLIEPHALAAFRRIVEAATS